MQMNFMKALNSSIYALDGKIGYLDDLLFDDKTWTVRYVVVRTGGLINRRRVLISPLGITNVYLASKAIELCLTAKQVENSPDVDTDRPVFRQMEKRYFDYYDWPYYWSDVSIWGVDSRSPFIVKDQPAESKSGLGLEQKSEGNPHLRSCREVSHYSLEAENARFGYVKDFLILSETWTLRYFLVESRKWWPFRMALIAPEWVDSVDWKGRCIHLALTEKEIKSSPKYSLGDTIDLSYEEKLHGHYHRPANWADPVHKKAR